MADGGDEPLHIEWFRVHHVDVVLQVMPEVTLRHGCRQDGARQQLRLMSTHMLEHGISVDARHHQVEHDQVIAIAVETLDRFAAVARGVDTDPLMADDRRQHRPDGVVIVDDQCFRLVHALSVQRKNPAQPHVSAEMTAIGAPMRMAKIAKGISSATTTEPMAIRKANLTNRATAMNGNARRLSGSIAKRRGSRITFATTANNATAVNATNTNIANPKSAINPN